jgi:hypothetical protein
MVGSCLLLELAVAREWGSGARRSPRRHIEATVPPLAVQAFADLVGSQPWPLQEFWPLQALLAVLQALVPLQELMPMQCTGAFIVFAAAGAETMPLAASAMAAAASVEPETTFIFMTFSLRKTSANGAAEERSSALFALFAGAGRSVTAGLRKNFSGCFRASPRVLAETAS